MNQKLIPIVAVMGHVDHGKTSLLDTIRGSNIVDTEAGGITQSVRAHLVDFGDGKKITFIDTPGHEAFSKMRSRGAQIADLAIIVVAADDGIQPQTKEALKFVKDEKIPVIIAINKIDLPHDNLMKLHTQLSTLGFQTETMGGDVMTVEISAKQNLNIDKLISSIDLVVEMNLEAILARSNSESEAEGIVLESLLDKAHGASSLVILRNGAVSNKARFVANDKIVSEFRVAKPSVRGEPVWVYGLDSVFDTGQVVRFFENKKIAEQEVEEIKISEQFNIQKKQNPFAMFKMMKNDNSGVLKTEADGTHKLNVIIKTDTRGSMEVLRSEIDRLNSENENKVEIKNSAEGEITQKDVSYAKDTKSIIVGFRTKIQESAKKNAIEDKVFVREYEIIYELIDDLEEILLSLGVTGLKEEVEVANALVKQVFTLSDKTIISGSVVQKGTILKGYRVKVLRKGEEVGRGKITSLRQGKNEVKEVTKGLECGILIDQKFEIQTGDIIQAYKVE